MFFLFRVCTFASVLLHCVVFILEMTVTKFCSYSIYVSAIILCPVLSQLAAFDPPENAKPLANTVTAFIHYKQPSASQFAKLQRADGAPDTREVEAVWP